MPRQPVLDGQNGDRRLGVLEKKGIVAHTEPQEDVEIGLGLVQNQGLQNGVAHGLVGRADADLLVIRKTDGFLRYGASLADDGYDLEPLVLKDLFHPGSPP